MSKLEEDLDETKETTKRSLKKSSRKTNKKKKGKKSKIKKQESDEYDELELSYENREDVEECISHLQEYYNSLKTINLDTIITKKKYWISPKSKS